MKHYYMNEPQIHPIIDAIVLAHLGCSLSEVRFDYEPLRNEKDFDEDEMSAMPERFKRTLVFEDVSEPDLLHGIMVLGTLDGKPFAYMQNASPMIPFYRDGDFD